MNKYLIFIIIFFLSISKISAYKQTDLDKLNSFKPLHLNADLSYANLSSRLLWKIDLWGANCFGTDFSNSELFNTDLRGHADFRRSNLTSANLTGAKAEDIILYNAGDILYDAEVKDSDWQNVTGLTNAQKLWLVAHGAINVPALSKNIATHKKIKDTASAKKHPIAQVKKARLLTRLWRYISARIACEKAQTTKK